MAFRYSEDVSTEELPPKGTVSSAQDDAKRLKKTLHKLDITLVLPVLVAAVLNGMDRSSLGLSKVVGLEADLGMSGMDFNIVASIIAPTLLVFMLPSNLVLRKVGARIWLSLITVAWGLINMSMAFVKTKRDLILCRIFLGVVESGFGPGVTMMIALWYPREAMTTRIGVFYSSFALSAIFGGPVATGLSKIQSERFRPWGWLFFVEGLITAGYGLVLYVLLADYPDESWVLTRDERETIQSALAGRRKGELNYKRVFEHLRDPLVYVHSLLTLANAFNMATILLFAAIIVREMGFSPGASQAMQAVPGICTLVGTNLARFYPKWFGCYWFGSLFSTAWSLAGAIVLLSTVNNGARIFGLCLIGFGAGGNICIGPGWIMNNAGGPARSAVLGATMSACGAIGGIITAYLYRNRDRPRYLFGHGMNIFGALLNMLVGAIAYYMIVRRGREKDRNPVNLLAMTQTEIENLENDHPDFRYVL